VSLLGAVEANADAIDLRPRDGRSWSHLAGQPDAFEQLGIESGGPVKDSAGKIYLHPHSLGGLAGDDPDELPRWVERFLVETPYVRKKLEKSGYEERHAFIRVTISTYYAAAATLYDDSPLSRLAPKLPGGISHLWVAGCLMRPTRARVGCRKWMSRCVQDLRRRRYQARLARADAASRTFHPGITNDSPGSRRALVLTGAPTLGAYFGP
jgi:hypothetical protein